MKILRRSGKPVVLAANKVDDQRTEAEAYGLWNLGLGEPYPGLRAARPRLRRHARRDPRGAARAAAGVAAPRSAARAGSRSSASPNVGKSSLLNKLAKEERVGRRRRRRHHRRPGRRAGRARRAHLAVHRHRRHPQAGQGGLRARVLRQPAHRRRHRARRGVRAGRRRLAADLRAGPADHHHVAEAGRALVIAFNKWDLVDEERRYYLDREIERDLVRVPWAPRINITARTGWHVDRLVPALDAALDGLGDPGRHRRAELVPRAAWSPSTRTRCAAASSRRSCSAPRPSTEPPTFVLFTTRPARGALPALHRAPAARGVRLRRHARSHVQQRPRKKRERR